MLLGESVIDPYSKWELIFGKGVFALRKRFIVLGTYGACGAQGENRTRTPDNGNRILSPACLPIPPPGHFKNQRDFNLSLF